MFLIELVGDLTPAAPSGDEAFAFVSNEPFDNLAHLLTTPPRDDVGLVVCHESHASIQKRVPDTLRHRPGAKILLVSSGSPTQELARDLDRRTGGGLRILGAAVKGSVQQIEANWTAVVAYLVSNEVTPWTEQFFGLDFPAQRMATMFALEIARSRLSPETSTNNGSTSSVDAQTLTLLQGAIQLANQTDSLAAAFAAIKVDGSASEVRDAIDAVLAGMSRTSPPQHS